MSLFPNSGNNNSFYFEAIFLYATIGIVITKHDGTITAVNPFALNEFRYDENELVGKRIEILVPERDREKHSTHHDKYTKNPQTRLMSSKSNLFARRKDGTEFPVEISLSSYEKGNKAYTIAFILNTTQRKKTEQEIIQLNKELKSKVEIKSADLKETTLELEISRNLLAEALAFQKAMLENAGAIIIATDNNGMITFFNPEAISSLGYSANEIVRLHTPVLFHDKTEIDLKREALFNEFGITIQNDFDVLVEKSRRGIHTEEQYTYKRKNKSGFPVVLSITTIRNTNGQVTGFMGIAIDITERKKAEGILLESLKRERELNELKSRFVSMASHEFRTPLSTILSSAYLIGKYPSREDQPKREKHLDRILSAVTTLTDILNDFLSVGKIEEGKIQVKPSTFNIRDFMITLTGELKNTLRKNQKIRYLHKGDEDIYMDSSLMKLIIMNLVSNASKFSPEESIIEIKTIRDSESFTLAVKDYGIGIPKADQEHLMERFFRGSNANSIQGTGLGLHIMAKYAELMNGKINCISEQGKGTEFIITFTTKQM